MNRAVSYASQQSASDASVEVRQRFSSTSYITSVAGILKFMLIVLFLLSGIFFLSISKCPNTAEWYVWVYPSVILFAAVLSLVLYSIFLFAIAKTNLEVWSTVDIVASLIAAAGVVVASVFTITTCTSGEPIHYVPAPLGLVGALLLAANAAATYIMVKYQDVEEPDDFEEMSRSRRFLRRFTLEATHT